MPMNIALPTNAKMTALVCSGRRRPNEVNCRFKFRSGQKSWQAISSPALKPTRPQITVAIANARTMRLSYLKVSMLEFINCEKASALRLVTFLFDGRWRGRARHSVRAVRTG